MPQSPHLNRGVWEQFEAAIRDCIDGGAGATLTVEEGIVGIVWAATLDDDGPSGGFFRDGERIDW